jgi:hypothetical protein
LERIPEEPDEFRLLREVVGSAIQLADVDPGLSWFNIRLVLIMVIKEVYEHRIGELPWENVQTAPWTNALQQLVNEGHFPARFDSYAHTIFQMAGSVFIPSGTRTLKLLFRSLSHIVMIVEWYVEQQGPDKQSAAMYPRSLHCPTFDPNPRDFATALRILMTPSGASRKGGPNVDCAVFAPPRVKRGESVMIQVHVYALGDEAEATARAKEFDETAVRRGLTTLEMHIRRGQVLCFSLSLHGQEVPDATRQLTWLGRTASVQFPVTLPTDWSTDALLGTVLVSTDGIPVGRIDFKLTVVHGHARTPSGEVTSVGHAATRFRKAFVAYAPPDRPEVLRRVQMLRPPLSDIEVFQETLSLKPGEAVEPVRQRQLEECDLFLLFWSSNARRSEAVARDIQDARRRQGPNGEPPPTILPVIIEGPPPPPPPPELAHLHFDDYMLYLLGGEQATSEGGDTRSVNGRLQGLKTKLSFLADDLGELEKLSGISVPSALNKARFVVEKVLHGLCTRKGVSWGQAEPTLERMIGPLVASDRVPKSVAVHVRTVQAYASPGSHYQESALSGIHLAIAKEALVGFLEWVAETAGE